MTNIFRILKKLLIFALFANFEAKRGQKAQKNDKKGFKCVLAFHFASMDFRSERLRLSQKGQNRCTLFHRDNKFIILVAC
jgi:hypothetical protein